METEFNSKVIVANSDFVTVICSILHAVTKYRLQRLI